MSVAERLGNLGNLSVADFVTDFLRSALAVLSASIALAKCEITENASALRRLDI